MNGGIHTDSLMKGFVHFLDLFVNFYAYATVLIPIIVAIVLIIVIVKRKNNSKDK